jgi:hypothetical protein
MFFSEEEVVLLPPVAYKYAQNISGDRIATIF